MRGHATLRRLRASGRDPRPFRRLQNLWIGIGVGLLLTVALLPFVAPESRALTERLAPLLALVYLVAAGGLWLGMGGRAVLAAAVLVLALYALTAWARLAFSTHDLHVLALLVGFLVYALAGFYLVFVLEEAVYDLHRQLHLRGRAWAVVPFGGIGALAILLPVARSIDAPVVWATSLAATVVLGSYWFVVTTARMMPGVVLRELHLFAFGALAAAAVIDSLRLLHDAPGVVPSLLAYGLLVGTWLYVSYTTLQRTHFLLRGRNAEPWLAILLGASFAILGHVQLLYAVGGASALVPVLDLRIYYLVAGIWIGLAFYALRSAWRLLRRLQRRGMPERTRLIAGRLARLTDSMVAAEGRLQTVAVRVYGSLDDVLPGRHRPPRPPRAGWEVEDGVVRRLDEEE